MLSILYSLWYSLEFVVLLTKYLDLFIYTQNGDDTFLKQLVYFGTYLFIIIIIIIIEIDMFPRGLWLAF